ncbi:unnamed protein product [Protopolystoma xenopodis]|uniref:ATPase dynein-related AAA domain-containing protein n=1 Tax=Protopolystoma xenopodis TaxID=117903 RepID=A0A3S5AEJ3_9PLAT|nr:unnamed protein product [Protopolystoma xenopodis]
MLAGDFFLIDEISLADDAVLERLNSLLEPERNLTLAERVSEANQLKPLVPKTSAPDQYSSNSTLNHILQDSILISASPSFRLFATMNPGGDYGKKELSPALRNRFTEIWARSPHMPCLESTLASLEPALTVAGAEIPLQNDWYAIVSHNLGLYFRPASAARVIDHNYIQCHLADSHPEPWLQLLPELVCPMAKAMVTFLAWYFGSACPSSLIPAQPESDYASYRPSK